MSARTTQNPEEFAVCMGMDALRLCLGQKPKTFTVEDVIRWLRLTRKTHA